MSRDAERPFPPFECGYCGKRKHIDRTKDYTPEREFACGVTYADCTDAMWDSGPTIQCVNKLRKRLGMKEAVGYV